MALRVGGTDPQGFHKLGTVFQAVSLGDEVIAQAAPAGQFRLSFQGEGAGFLPVDDTNLAMRAAKLLARRFGVDDAGVTLTIRKRIPVAGGMAGGSADAAGVLVACNALWHLGATRDQLQPLAAVLGSDVPFLLLGGTAIGTGRGIDLAPVITSGTYHWAFALSHSGLSTPSVFGEFDRTSEPGPPRSRPRCSRRSARATPPPSARTSPTTSNAPRSPSSRASPTPCGSASRRGVGRDRQRFRAHLRLPRRLRRPQHRARRGPHRVQRCARRPPRVRPVAGAQVLP
nr:hypothetical protein [Tessaracoccus coleopterorum]